MNDILFQIFAVLSDGVIATDAQGKVIFMNNAAEKLTGWSFKEANGRPLREVFKIVEQHSHIELKTNPVDEALTTGQPTELTNNTILKSQTGEETVIEKCGLPIKDENENVIGAVLVLRENEKETKTAQQIKERVTLESTNLADSITHKFNNLLMSIWGNASLVRMKTVENKDIADNVHKIEDSCRQARELSKLLNSCLRDFSKENSSLTIADNNKSPVKLQEKLPAFNRNSGHVLVMDDEEMLRELTSRCLIRLGYKVTTAKDGSEVIRLFTQAMDSRPFDAVIMDLTVPGGLGGKETIAALKKIDPDVKAIIASGYSDDPVLNDYLKYGFCAVIRKPFHINELQEILNKVLS